MRSTLFIALGAIAAFVAGLAGTYFVLPVVAPGVAEAQRMRADSVAAADSLTLAALTPAPQAEALPEPAVVPDSTAALRDSLAALRQRLASYEEQIDAFESSLSVTQARRVQAGDLATTLTKLEDRELARVLDRLDFDVLETLYAELSARNRARLLGALDPARTAVFIRRATASKAPSTPPVPDEEELAAPDASTPSPR